MPPQTRPHRLNPSVWPQTFRRASSVTMNGWSINYVLQSLWCIPSMVGRQTFSYLWIFSSVEGRLLLYPGKPISPIFWVRLSTCTDKNPPGSGRQAKAPLAHSSQCRSSVFFFSKIQELDDALVKIKCYPGQLPQQTNEKDWGFPINSQSWEESAISIGSNKFGRS